MDVLEKRKAYLISVADLRFLCFPFFFSCLFLLQDVSWCVVLPTSLGPQSMAFGKPNFCSVFFSSLVLNY